MVKLIVLPNRSELPLELVFTPDINLASHNGESVALYISGCPAMHLFELIMISLESSDEPEIIRLLWHALYVDNWDDVNEFKVIVSGDSRVHLYKLYDGTGLDSIKLIRHHTNCP